MEAFFFTIGSLTAVFCFVTGFATSWLVTPYLPPLNRFFSRPVKSTPFPKDYKAHKANPLIEDDMDEIMKRIKDDEELTNLKEYYEVHVNHKDNNGWLMQ